MSLEAFVSEWAAGQKPGCCFINTEWNEGVQRFEVTYQLSTGEYALYQYPPGSLLKPLNKIRAHLESAGWRIFTNKFDWEAYLSNGIRPPATLKEVRMARCLYDSDDVQVDQDALISDAREDAGRWVQAWVWVSDEDLKGEEDDSD